MTVTPATRARILQRDGLRCAECLRPIRDPRFADIDHIRPVSKMGGNELTNLRVLCRRHNRARGNRESWTPRTRRRSLFPQGRKLQSRGFRKVSK